MITRAALNITSFMRRVDELKECILARNRADTTPAI
jgi:hypothetical protein